MSHASLQANIFPPDKGTFSVSLYQSNTTVGLAERNTTTLSFESGHARFMSLFLSQLTSDQLSVFGRELEDVGIAIQQMAIDEAADADDE